MAETDPDALPGDAEFERQVAVMLAAYQQRAKRRTMVADAEGAVRIMLRALQRANAEEHARG